MYNGQIWIYLCHAYQICVDHKRVFSFQYIGGDWEVSTWESFASSYIHITEFCIFYKSALYTQIIIDFCTYFSLFLINTSTGFYNSSLLVAFLSKRGHLDIYYLVAVYLISFKSYNCIPNLPYSTSGS